MAVVVVEVMPKLELLDPQGQAVLGATHRLGFAAVRGVRQGKRFEVQLDGDATPEAVAEVERLAGTLLANPVIEDWSVHVEAGTARA